MCHVITVVTVTWVQMLHKKPQGKYNGWLGNETKFYISDSSSLLSLTSTVDVSLYRNVVKQSVWQLSTLLK